MANMTAIKDFTEGVRESTDDLDHLEAADALGELLSGTATVEDTAKTITMIYEPSLEENPDGTWMNEHNKLFYFWGHHIDSSVRSFCGDEVQEQRLLDLLMEISKQPDVRNSDGSLKKFANVRVYWRDLPGLSFDIFESLDYNHPSVFNHSDGSDFLAQGPGFLIATKFAASLLQRGMFAHDLQGKAVSVLWQALEDPNIEGFGEAIIRLERQLLLPAAVTWILVAGEAVFNYCFKEGTVAVGIDCQGRPITSYRQCWANWKVRFQEFAVDEDVSDEGQTLAFRAANKMVEVEAGYTG